MADFEPFYPEKGPGGPSRGWANCLIFLAVFLILVVFVALVIWRSG